MDPAADLFRRRVGGQRQLQHARVLQLRHRPPRQGHGQRQPQWLAQVGQFGLRPPLQARAVLRQPALLLLGELAYDPVGAILQHALHGGQAGGQRRTHLQPFGAHDHAYAAPAAALEPIADRDAQ
ncbi:hypothetical protein D3C71_1871510 [compost metagenome]